MDTRLNASNIAHLAIARAVYRGVLDDREVDALVEELVGDQDAAMRRRVPKTLVTQSVLSFLWHFDLRATHALVGYEHPVRGGRVDLVWKHRHDASIVFDEIKTGMSAVRPLLGLKSQYTALARGGSEQFGESFVGLRQLTLLHPRRAMLRTAATTVRPLPARLRARGGS